MLAQTVEAEAEAFVAAHEYIRDEQGRRLVIRIGYVPECTIQTGIGDIAVKAPRVRDRNGSGIRFTSAILPPYPRRTKSIGLGAKRFEVSVPLLGPWAIAVSRQMGEGYFLLGSDFGSCLRHFACLGVRSFISLEAGGG